ncbi:hypothetical protein VP01_9645g1, partial [Puccinia sorghi]
ALYLRWQLVRSHAPGTKHPRLLPSERKFWISSSNQFRFSANFHISTDYRQISDGCNPMVVQAMEQEVAICLMPLLMIQGSGAAKLVGATCSQNLEQNQLWMEDIGLQLMSAQLLSI